MELIGLKTGARLRHANGGLWHVLGVLAEDSIAVARHWAVDRQSWIYETIRPTELMVGLYRKEGDAAC